MSTEAPLPSIADAASLMDVAITAYASQTGTLKRLVDRISDIQKYVKKGWRLYDKLMDEQRRVEETVNRAEMVENEAKLALMVRAKQLALIQSSMETELDRLSTLAESIDSGIQQRRAIAGSEEEDSYF